MSRWNVSSQSPNWRTTTSRYDSSLSRYSHSISSFPTFLSEYSIVIIKPGWTFPMSQYRSPAMLPDRCLQPSTVRQEAASQRGWQFPLHQESPPIAQTELAIIPMRSLPDSNGIPLKSPAIWSTSKPAIRSSSSILAGLKCWVQS